MNRFRQKSGQYGLLSTLLAAGILVYQSTESTYDRQNDAALFQVVIAMALFVGLILGLLGLPKLESFFALFGFTVTSILFFATL